MSKRILPGIRNIIANPDDLDQYANKIFIGLLVVFGVASHLIWFNPSSVLFHSDWLHWTDGAARQAWQALGTWSTFFGFGEPRIQIGFTLVQSLWSLVGALGGNFDMGVKVSLLWPIAVLGFLSPYFAMRKLYDNDFIAFVAAMFYGSTAYFLLRQGSHLPIAFVYAIAPLMFLIFMKALQTMAIKWWLGFVLLYSIGLCYEIRIMYIFTFILLLYTALFFDVRKSVGKTLGMLVMTGVMLLGLNAFWLLPTALGSAGSTITDTTSQELFGNFLFDLQHSISLSPASWTGGVPDESFVKQPVPLYMWLIPIVIFGSLLTLKNPLPQQKRLMLFFVIITLLGWFLTKQVERPLPDAYPWLYGNFPGFSLFREASKFYLFTAFGYMGLLALGLQSLREANYKAFQVAAAVPLAVALVNVTPLVTGNIRSMFVSRQIPSEYAELNKMIAEQPGVFRTMWVPSDPKWGYFDETHPRVSAAAVSGANLKPLLDDASNYTARRRLAQFFDRPIANKLLDSAAVKYVVVPLRDIDNQDDFMRYYGDDRQYYVDMLDNLPWLRKMPIGADKIAVYENTDYSPHIGYATSLYNLTSAAELDDYFVLNEQQLKQDFNFTVKDKDSVAEGRRLQGVFEDLQTLDIRKGAVDTKLELPTSATFLANAEASTLRWSIKDSQINLEKVASPSLVLAGMSFGERTQSVQTVLNAHLVRQRQYYMVNGKEVVAIDADQAGERFLGEPKGEVRLLANESANLIANHSLEKGLWQPKVDDCNNYDDEPDVYMNLSNIENTHGRNSMSLTAAKHIACSGPDPIAVRPGAEYALSFDVRGDDADEVGFIASFNDASGTKIKRYTTISNKSWRRVNQVLMVPQGADKLDIQFVGMPNTRTRRPAITYYDNVNLVQVTTIASLPQGTPALQAKQITAGQHVFGLRDTSYSGANLVPNASLENGLWRKTVEDCNAYDDKADIQMSSSPHASVGKASLELRAKRHIACTGPPAIAVKENSYYLLTFDHQSPNAKSASYYISFRGQDVAAPPIAADVPTSAAWETYTRLVRVPTGAKELQLSVRARANERLKTHLVNRYDNFRLVELPQNVRQHYIVGDQQTQSNGPAKLTYAVEDPTKRLIQISGASEAFYLTMAESYNKSWRLLLDNSHVGWLPWSKPDIVASGAHIKWNGFTNGWYIDPAAVCGDMKAGCTRRPDGGYDIRLVAEFASQRWFYAGVAISLMTLFLGALLLMVSWLYGRSKRKKRSWVHR